MGSARSVSYDPPKPQPMPAACRPWLQPSSGPRRRHPQPPSRLNRCTAPEAMPAPPAAAETRGRRMFSYATAEPGRTEHPANGSGGGMQAARQTRQRRRTQVVYKGAESSAPKPGRPWTAICC